MTCSSRSTPFGFTIPQELRCAALPFRSNNLYTTADIRQAWINSHKSEKLGHRLPVRKFPMRLLRQQAAGRQVHCKSADPQYWISKEDKEKIAERRRCFERQWSAEITKRNETIRPSYTITMQPQTPPIKTFMTAPCVNTEPLFHKSNLHHRPKTREEKIKTSRHFVSPEWKSEMISWKRFNTSLDIHKLSVF